MLVLGWVRWAARDIGGDFWGLAGKGMVGRVFMDWWLDDLMLFDGGEGCVFSFILRFDFH